MITILWVDCVLMCKLACSLNLDVELYTVIMAYSWFIIDISWYIFTASFSIHAHIYCRTFICIRVHLIKNSVDTRVIYIATQHRAVILCSVLKLTSYAFIYFSICCFSWKIFAEFELHLYIYSLFNVSCFINDIGGLTGICHSIATAI